MEKHHKIIILTCLVISGAAALYLFRPSSGMPGQNQPNSEVKIPDYSPPMVEAKASPQETSVIAPDGKYTLTMKAVPAAGGSKSEDNTNYTFYISDEEGKKEIYSKTAGSSESLSIPANTFSPDGKYIFLKETGANGTSYIALSATGDPITKDTQTFVFSDMFAAKYPNYKITEATGWGGVNLIVFNTEKAEGGPGPSFWFEVPSGAFIQLSTKFN